MLANFHGMDQRLMTLAEAAHWLHVPEATLRWWRHNAVGPRGFRVGRRVMYERAELRRWLREQAANDARTPSRP